MRKSIQIFLVLLFSFDTNAKDFLFVRCVDADNLEHIERLNIVSASKKLEIKDLKNGVYQLINFKKGTEITISAENYNEVKYHRPKKFEEIAIKNNGEQLLKSGDTLVIELLLKDELLLSRWQAEDLLFPNYDTTNVETNTETKPSFIDEKEFKRILSSKLHFPNHLINQSVEGKVYISAIVEIDGALTNFRIIRNLDPNLDRIALRALRSSEIPKLNPATKDNMPVRSKILIPINFNLK